MVNSLNRLGTLYRTRNADSCFYYGMEAKRLATNIRYRNGQTEADHVIAFALFKKGLYAESLELLGKLFTQYQQLNDSEKMIQAYLDMLTVENKGISDIPKLTSLLHKAIQIGRRLEKDSIMAEVYMRYLLRGPDLSEDSIRYYLNKSKAIASRYNDEYMLALNRDYEAYLLLSDGRKEEALPLILESISDAKRIGNSNLAVNVHFLMVGYYGTDFKRVLDQYYHAYEAAQKSGDKSLEIYILHSALEVAKELGDKDEIIKIYVELDKAMTAEWERSRKFMGDYIRYNYIELDNKLLSEKNAQRALWLVVISFFAAIVVLAIYLIMLRRNRKAKEKIETLNEMANIQIMAVEEMKHEAVREEQQRLGQDLHDGLSSTIAGIKNHLEILSLDLEDSNQKNRLSILRQELTKAYESARNKSHEWYLAGEAQDFEQQVISLVESALPGNTLQKHIQIDTGVMWRVNLDTRITLLRIIQEAIANIIKHAKAKNIDILLYEELGNLLLTIKDDGKGLDRDALTKNKSSLGMQSMQRRVQFLNGNFSIQSPDGGTEINVAIPLNQI